MADQHRQVLDPRGIMEQLEAFGHIAHAKAFADFDQAELRNQTSMLATCSIEAIHVPSQVVGDKIKSHVDFRMLDDIYQTLMDRPDIDTYVLGTGDGHFSGVAGRLRVRHKKRVIVLGVLGCVKRELALAASDTIFIEPEQASPIDPLDVIRFVYNGQTRNNIITFTSTVRVYSRVRNQPESEVRRVLVDLLNDDVFRRRIANIEGKEINIMHLNMDHAMVMDALGYVPADYLPEPQ